MNSAPIGRATIAGLCLLALVVAAPLASGASPPARLQEQPDADNTATEIRAHSNGSATWTVRVRTRLDTDDDVEHFETFQDRFRRNESRYLNPFRDRIRRVVAVAADETGREMNATAFAASTSIQEVPRRWGVVTYRFTWTGFAEARNGTLAVGDVFRGGFFLAANDSLDIVPPDRHEVTGVAPTPDEREPGLVRWRGREDFDDGRPRVLFEPAGPSTADPTPTEEPSSEDTRGGPESTASPSSAASAETDGPPSTPNRGGDQSLLVVVLLFGAGAGAYTLWARRGVVDGLRSGESASDAETAASAGAAAADGEILTDAERVRRVLDANGGRVKQAAIAEALDWSPSKTSRIVGDMVEEGTVEKLQLGRENVIDLPEPDD